MFYEEVLECLLFVYGSLVLLLFGRALGLWGNTFLPFIGSSSKYKSSMGF